MADTDTQGQAPAGESAAPEPDDNRSQVVADIMSFDPFGPAEPAKAEPDATGTTEGEGGEGGGEPEKVEEPTDAPAPIQDPKAAAAPAQTPTQQGPTQREQELQAQIAALTAAIQRTQAPKPEEKPAEKAANKYNLGLPPQLIQGLRSENDEEFAVSMHAVVNGIANKVWNDVQEHLSKVIMPQTDQRISTVMEHNTQVRRVHDEFYGAHPHLNNPALMPLVQQAALAVAQSWAAVGKPIAWNKEFADSVAGYVGQFIPAPQTQQKPTPQKRTFTASPGSRPAPAVPNEFGELLS